MMEFDKMCKKYEDLPFLELKEIVRNESRIILPALDAVEGDGMGTFLLLVSTACGADGMLDPEEYFLFRDATGIDISYEEMMQMVNGSSGRDAVQIVDSIADLFGVLDEDVKYSIVIFCLAFCAANGEIGAKEKRLIRKLLRE